MSFGEFIHLPPQVSVLLPDPFQVSLGLLGGSGGDRLEAQAGSDGLLRSFRHGGWDVLSKSL